MQDGEISFESHYLRFPEEMNNAPNQSIRVMNRDAAFEQENVVAIRVSFTIGSGLSAIILSHLL